MLCLGAGATHFLVVPVLDGILNILEKIEGPPVSLRQAFQALPDDNETVRRICASSAPLLVYDHFTTRPIDYGKQEAAAPNIDINGDTIPDSQHGDGVAAVAALSGKRVMTFGARFTLEQLNPKNLKSDLDEILALIDDGHMPAPAAVIMSLSHDEDLPPGYAGRTPANLNETKDELTAAFSDPRRKGYYGLWKTILTFRQRGIPIVTADGNEYTDRTVNLYGVMGAITVGALTQDDKEHAPYGNQSILARIYRRGDYPLYKVPGGISFEAGGKPAFPDKDLSHAPETVALLQGRIPGSEPEIWPTTKVLALNYPQGEQKRFQGSARLYGEWTHRSGTTFHTDRNGRLVFDPAHNGDPTQVKLITGTSLASPAICNPPPAPPVPSV